MIESMLVPVFEKNVVNTLICISSVSMVTNSMSSVSMALSVTTVPRAFGNDYAVVSLEHSAACELSDAGYYEACCIRKEYRVDRR